MSRPGRKASAIDDAAGATAAISDGTFVDPMKTLSSKELSRRIWTKVRDRGRCPTCVIVDELVSEIRAEVNEAIRILRTSGEDQLLLATLETEGKSKSDKRNVQRRVYDSLNVLVPLGILARGHERESGREMLEWVGLDAARGISSTGVGAAPTGSIVTNSVVDDAGLRDLRDKIEERTQALRELVLGQLAYRQLVTQNQRAEERNGTPAALLQLPFLTVLAPAHADVHVDMDWPSKREMLFHFDAPFRLLEPPAVLRLAGLYDFTAEQLSGVLPPHIARYFEGVGDSTAGAADAAAGDEAREGEATDVTDAAPATAAYDAPHPDAARSSAPLHSSRSVTVRSAAPPANAADALAAAAAAELDAPDDAQTGTAGGPNRRMSGRRRRPKVLEDFDNDDDFVPSSVSHRKRTWIVDAADTAPAEGEPPAPQRAPAGASSSAKEPTRARAARAQDDTVDSASYREGASGAGGAARTAKPAAKARSASPSESEASDEFDDPPPQSKRQRGLGRAASRGGRDGVRARSASGATNVDEEVQPVRFKSIAGLVRDVLNSLVGGLAYVPQSGVEKKLLGAVQRAAAARVGEIPAAVVSWLHSALLDARVALSSDPEASALRRAHTAEAAIANATAEAQARTATAEMTARFAGKKANALRGAPAAVMPAISLSIAEEQRAALQSWGASFDALQQSIRRAQILRHAYEMRPAELRTVVAALSRLPCDVTVELEGDWAAAAAAELPPPPPVQPDAVVVPAALPRVMPPASSGAAAAPGIPSQVLPQLLPRGAQPPPPHLPNAWPIPQPPLMLLPPLQPLGLAPGAGGAGGGGLAPPWIGGGMSSESRVSAFGHAPSTGPADALRNALWPGAPDTTLLPNAVNVPRMPLATPWPLPDVPFGAGLHRGMRSGTFIAAPVPVPATTWQPQAQYLQYPRQLQPGATPAVPGAPVTVGSSGDGHEAAALAVGVERPSAKSEEPIFPLPMLKPASAPPSVSTMPSVWPTAAPAPVTPTGPLLSAAPLPRQ